MTCAGNGSCNQGRSPCRNDCDHDTPHEEPLDWVGDLWVATTWTLAGSAVAAILLLLGLHIAGAI